MLKRIATAIRRESRIWLNKKRAPGLGIEFSPPNYIYKGRLSNDSLVVDVGCADDPDLSLFMINSFGVRAIAVDPTRKHFASLERISNQHGDQLTHLPLAVAAECGQLTFHESEHNASGSLLQSHLNVVNDPTVSYEVEAVTIPELIRRVGAERIDFLKLDLEGIEYQLLSELAGEDVQNVDQLFIEFHHHCIPEFTVADTAKLVSRVMSFGFQSFTLDHHNYLFYR